MTESLERRMVLPFGSSLAETNHVLGHETVQYIADAATGRVVRRLTASDTDPHITRDVAKTLQAFRYQ